MAVLNTDSGSSSRVGLYGHARRRSRTHVVGVAGFLLGAAVGASGTALAQHHAAAPGCAICSYMVSEIFKRSPELAAKTDAADTQALFRHATTMLTLWTVPVGDYVHEAGAIVGFAFAQGAPDSADGPPTPGGTNRGLAWSVVQLLDAYARAGRPRPLVMVQWEIAQVLWEEHGVRADVSATVDAEGNYLSTYGVMAQLATALDESGVRSVALVAHPDHAVRCGKVVQHFNVTAIGTAFLGEGGGIPWDRFGCDADGYDAASTQPWTTGRARYLLHELKNRPAMVIAGQVDFSNDGFEAGQGGRGTLR